MRLLGRLRRLGRRRRLLRKILLGGLLGWFARLAASGLELLGRAFRFEPLLTRSRVMMMADNFGYSIDKARRELGYEPRTGLRDGIAATVESYRKAGEL